MPAKFSTNGGGGIGSESDPVAAPLISALDARVDALEASKPGWFNVKAYGAVGDWEADDTAAIQAAIDAAAASASEYQWEATVYIPHGTYWVTSELVYPTAPHGIRIVGDGMEASVLAPSVDFGAGTFVLRPDALQASRPPELANFGVRGPGTDSAIGVAPCAMSGLQVCSGAVVRRVKATRCNAGIDLAADHNRVEFCVSTANLDGLRFGLEVNAEGDQFIVGCNLDGNKRSSIVVAGSNSMDGVTVLSTHLGNSPVGIFKETPATVGSYAANTNAITNCSLIDVSFEGIGNAVIYCQAGATAGAGAVTNNRFSSCQGGSIFNVTFQDAGLPTAAAVVCDEFDDNQLDGNSTALTTFGSSYLIDCVSFNGGSWRVPSLSVPSGRTIIPDAASFVPTTRFEIGGTNARLYQASGVTAVDDEVHLGSPSYIVDPPGGSGPVVGTARHAATSGQRLIVSLLDTTALARLDGGNSFVGNQSIDGDTFGRGDFYARETFATQAFMGDDGTGHASLLLGLDYDVGVVRTGAGALDIVAPTALTLNGGALGGSGGAPSGPAGGVLGGTYPNPSFAADMATQAELDTHKTSADHDGRYYTETEVDTALNLKLAKASNLSDLANAATARTNLGLGTAAVVNTGTASGNVPLLSTGGVLPIARLATGTPDGTKFVRDDGTLATPSGGGTAEAWTTPTFAGTWANFGNPWATAAYRKDADGTVRLRGLVNGGTSTIFTLAAGYRPPSGGDLMFPVSTNSGLGELRITSAGTVTLQSGGTGYVSLNGVTFST